VHPKAVLRGYQLSSCRSCDVVVCRVRIPVIATGCSGASRQGLPMNRCLYDGRIKVDEKGLIVRRHAALRHGIDRPRRPN